ncbi:hypothetical protein AEQ27_05190 [Frigoribacterium sp. RIT-PI-h]|nr:hypothetical protein AEQ27_05190 [Frigoribacterium sp. RIT-PI-h]
MVRPLEDAFGRADLDDAAAGHHGDPVGDAADDREVVADEAAAEPLLVTQSGEQVEHAGLHADVEGRRDLVGDDQLGPGGERPGDAGALALTARELGGRAGGELGGQADFDEQFGGALGTRLAGEELERSGDRGADGAAGGERGVGGLEDQLGRPAPRRPAPGGGSGGGAPASGGAVGGEPARLGGDQPGEGRGERGLAAAGLPHDGEGLAAADGERDAVDRGGQAAPVPDDEVARRDDRPRGGCSPRVLRRASCECSGCDVRVAPRFVLHTPTGRGAVHGTRCGGGVHAWDAREQLARVLVLRVREQRRGRRVLDDPALVHDGDLVRHGRHDAEVVADQHDRHAEFDRQIADQFEHGRLRHDVEGGGRLVEHQKLRSGRDGHGDRDALLLSARELVRVAPHDRLGAGPAPVSPEFEHAVVAAGQSVALECLAQLASDAHRRGERLAGVLGDQGRRTAAQGPARPLGEGEHVVPGDAHAARHDP